MKSEIFKQPLQNLWCVMRNGTAAWGILLTGYMLLNSTVMFMSPLEQTWCRGNGFVQAKFTGYKIHDRWPVPDSFNGQARFNSDFFDVLFEFPNDPTPNSSRPKWSTSFGVWRWNVENPSEVLMTMRHTDGLKEYPSSFGPYVIPEDIQPCKGE